MDKAKIFESNGASIFYKVIGRAYPLVLMESLSNGVLPAASYFSGFAEGLDALVDLLGEATVERLRLPTQPPGLVSSMADKLAALLADDFGDDLRERLHRQAVQSYDWSIRAEQMAEAYAGFIKAAAPNSCRA